MMLNIGLQVKPQRYLISQWLQFVGGLEVIIKNLIITNINNMEQIIKKYTHEERAELLKQAMGEERYNKAVDELMPFGGGMSEYYDFYKIPYNVIEPLSN